MKKYDFFLEEVSDTSVMVQKLKSQLCKYLSSYVQTRYNSHKLHVLQLGSLTMNDYLLSQHIL